jgi:hypothetical protein
LHGATFSIEKGVLQMCEEWNVPKVFSKALAVFQTFGTVVSTEMKHAQLKTLIAKGGDAI